MTEFIELTSERGQQLQVLATEIAAVREMPSGAAGYSAILVLRSGTEIRLRTNYARVMQRLADNDEDEKDTEK